MKNWVKQGCTYEHVVIKYSFALLGTHNVRVSRLVAEILIITVFSSIYLYALLNLSTSIRNLKWEVKKEDLKNKS